MVAPYSKHDLVRYQTIYTQTTGHEQMSIEMITEDDLKLKSVAES